MKIKRFRIDNLYGRTIDIDLSKSVVVIFGHNGVGKTLTLNIMDAIYNFKFYKLLEIEFDKITITNSSQRNLYVLRTKENGYVQLEFKKTIDGLPIGIINADMLEHFAPENIRHITPSVVFDNKTKKTYSWNLYQESAEYIDILKKNLPKDLTIELLKVNVQIIHAQRLISLDNRTESSQKIRLFAKQMRQIIRDAAADSVAISHKLERTFPKRLLEQCSQNNSQALSSEDIAVKYADFIISFINLKTSGFVEGNLPSKELPFTANLRNDKTILNVIDLFLSDSIHKLEPLQEIAKKNKLFIESINSKLEGKKIEINPQDGFAVYPMNSKDAIPLHKLSSGEQNIINLFFDLIFNGKGKDIVLIDEPELSLHIDWLEKLLDDFVQITSQTKTSMLIATHSPDFIGSNIELTQNLR